MSSYGLSVFGFVLALQIFCTTSMPFVTRPKTVCLLSNHGYLWEKKASKFNLIEHQWKKKWLMRLSNKITVGKTEIKNWLPFVFGPAFAMESVYGRSWRNDGWNSSLKSPPQMDSPPVPVPVGSPVCTINPLITRWNICPLKYPFLLCTQKFSTVFGHSVPNSFKWISPRVVWIVAELYSFWKPKEETNHTQNLFILEIAVDVFIDIDTLAFWYSDNIFFWWFLIKYISVDVLQVRRHSSTVQVKSRLSGKKYHNFINKSQIFKSFFIFLKSTINQMNYLNAVTNSVGSALVWAKIGLSEPSCSNDKAAFGFFVRPWNNPTWRGRTLSPLPMIRWHLFVSMFTSLIPIIVG